MRVACVHFDLDFCLTGVVDGIELTSIVTTLSRMKHETLLHTYVVPPIINHVYYMQKKLLLATNIYKSELMKHAYAECVTLTKEKIRHCVCVCVCGTVLSP